MMRTTMMLMSAALALASLAAPAQADVQGQVENILDDVRPLPIPHVEGTCLVDEDPEYRVCVRTDNGCPRVTYRGFFGEGSIPYCW